MKYQILLTAEAEARLSALEKDPSLRAQCKAVKKALDFMEDNLRHPSLRTHRYYSLAGPHGEEVFEAYAQQKRPSPYRIFWYYGPRRGKITVITIIPHP